jgi:hypothetical protein
MRAFFCINGIQGDGTDESPFRPFHIDNLIGWAACYKINASESLVLAEVENPTTFSRLDGVTFIGLLTNLQDDIGNLRNIVESTLQSFANIEKAN